MITRQITSLLLCLTCFLDLSIPLSRQKDKILIWNPLGERTAEYGYFDPNEINQIDVHPVITSKASPDSPYMAIALSFSPYSDKLVYITKGQFLNLWWADVNLQNKEVIWQDKDRWLGNIANFLDVKISWGVDERYLIIFSHTIESHMMVYDFIEQKAWTFSGMCNLFAKSVTGNEFSLWCSNNVDTGPLFLALENQGIVPTNSKPKSPSIEVIEWAYSKSDHRVLLATTKKEIAILEADGEILSLPVYLEDNSDMDLTIRKSLQWSSNGKRVLVYASEKTPGYCPKKKNTGLDQGYYERSCWFVFDSNQGRVLWYPAEDVTKATTIPLEYLEFYYDAALSPDGEGLVTTYTDSRMGHAFHLVISSINQKKSETIALEQGQTIHWVRRELSHRYRHRGR